MFPPTRSTVALSIAILLIVAGVLLRDRRVLAMAVPFILYAGVTLLVTPRGTDTPHISVSRGLSADRVTEGGTIDVTLSITNNGGPIPWIGITDRIPSYLELTRGEVSHLSPLDSGERIEFSYTLRLPRGMHEISGLEVTTWPWITLLAKHSFIEHPSSLLAVPIVEPIDDVEIRPERTRAYAGVVRARTGGSGLDFFGCHSYTTGDDIRRINWRAYARTRELIVNEYEQERIADVTVFLDARNRANPHIGGQRAFDYAVRAAASMSDYFIKEGNSVGLFIYGEYMNWTFPGYGKNQMRRILDSLAQADTSDKEVFDDLQAVPTRLFPPRSQLVMISAGLDEHDVEVIGVLRARGYRIIVIIPDMLAYEVSQIQQGEARDLALRIISLRRRMILDALMHIGVEVVQWDINDSLAGVVSWTLSRRGRRMA